MCLRRGHFGGAVLPHLTDDHGVGVGLPHRLVDAVNKVVRQLVGYVQPPGVRPRPQPAADDAVLVSEDIVPIGGLGLVDGGQGVDPPPGVVLVRPVGEIIPLVVGTVLGLAGPVLRVGTVPVEVPAHIALMVEHAVQHDADAQLVGGVAQGAEILLVSQHGVDLLIVAGTVAVVLRGLKDGAEVEGLHPQAVEVGQLLHDPLQIAAEEIPVAHLAVGVGPVLRLLPPAGVDGASPRHAGGVGHSGAAEAVGEDLIGDALPKPAGYHIGAVVHRQLVGAQLLLAAVQAGQAEGVPHQAYMVPGVQGDPEHVPVAVDAVPGHGQLQPPLLGGLEVGDEHRLGKALRPEGAQGERHRAIGLFIPAVPAVKGHCIQQRKDSLQRIKVFSVPTDSMVCSLPK